MDRRTPRARWRLLAATAVVLLSACGGAERGIESRLDPDLDPDFFFAGDSIVLRLSGTISGDPPVIEFEPVLRQATDEQSEVKSGPWTLTIETNHGSLDVPFDVTDEIGGDHPPAQFSVPLQPAPAGIVRRVSVSLDGDEIGAVEGNDTVPSITIGNQIQGRTIPVDEFVIEWSSDDPEAAAKAFLTVDDGVSWMPITDWTSNSTIRVPPDVLPIGEAEVDVAVSDGVNAVGLRTGRFTLIPAD